MARGLGPGQGQARRLTAGRRSRLAGRRHRQRGPIAADAAARAYNRRVPCRVRVAGGPAAAGRARRCLPPRSVKSMIPNDFIQTLLSRVDIVDVIDRYVPLKKAGANYVACCPFHSEKTPVVHGQPDQAVLPLLRLRRARHGDRLPDGVRRQGVSRRGRGARARRRPRGAAHRAPRRRASGARRRRTSPTSLLAAAKFYRAQLKDAPRAIDYLKEPRPHRRDRRALRHRLRAGRLAAARARVSPTTTTRRSKPRAW